MGSFQGNENSMYKHFPHFRSLLKGHMFCIFQEHVETIFQILGGRPPLLGQASFSDMFKVVLNGPRFGYNRT